MKVKNRSASVAGYRIPDSNVRRRFLPGEIKDIAAEELKQLLFQPGGRKLLENYLQVSAEDLKKLEMDTPEREYFYSDEEIKRIITAGSLDEFLDMLDFAPQGVINLVKTYAVSLPITDLYKIKALREKTGFDAEKTIANTEDIEETHAEAPKRRTGNDKYKVISDN